MNKKTMVVLALALTACESTPVSDEQQRQVARRLVQPFLQQRTVICNELDVTISANFLAHVGNPGVNKLRHRFERTAERGLVHKVWTNIAGTQDSLFTVTIGEPPDPTDVSGNVGPKTTFKVINQFRLHVREEGAWTMAAETKGPILIVKEANAPRDMREFSVVDGVVTRR